MLSLFPLDSEGSEGSAALLMMSFSCLRKLSLPDAIESRHFRAVPSFFWSSCFSTYVNTHNAWRVMHRLSESSPSLGRSLCTVPDGTDGASARATNPTIPTRSKIVEHVASSMKHMSLKANSSFSVPFAERVRSIRRFLLVILLVSIVSGNRYCSRLMDTDGMFSSPNTFLKIYSFSSFLYDTSIVFTILSSWLRDDVE